jgi:hypothetical protein
MIRTVALSASCIISAVPRVTSQQPVVVLHQVGNDLPDTFGQISGVRELPNGGGVIVFDWNEKRVWLAHMAAGTRDVIGKTGDGPLEYIHPIAISAIGSETAIVDFSLNRLLIFDAQGKPERAQPLTGPRAEFAANAVQVDNHGNAYLLSPSVTRGPDGLRVASSRAVLRVRPGATTADTMALLPMIEGDAVMQAASGGGFSFQSGLANPFAPRDVWTVTPDGRVAVVHAAPYRIEWTMPDGTRRSGPPLKYVPLPVTAADRSEYAAHHGGIGGGGVGVSAPGGKRVAEAEQRNDWPATKPPFAFGAARADGDGNIWVLRTPAPGDTLRHYDVIGADGTVLRRCDLPVAFRVIGFGKNRVYASHEVSDDIHRLAMFALPLPR